MLYRQSRIGNKGNAGTALLNVCGGTIAAYQQTAHAVILNTRLPDAYLRKAFLNVSTFLLHVRLFVAHDSLAVWLR
jgi:hypothetical protein